MQVGWRLGPWWPEIHTFINDMKAAHNEALAEIESNKQAKIVKDKLDRDTLFTQYLSENRNT